MTTGEIIQYHRKRLSMSQEDLGQKLLVSRQTISQWEKGQTIPTTDNLIRLKEIFDVSVDELLGFDSKDNQETENQGNIWEQYVFGFSKDEVVRILKTRNKTNNNKLILCAVIFPLLTIYAIGIDAPSGTVGFLVGIMFMYLVLYLKARAMAKKTNNTATERIPQNTYTYKVFDNHFTIEIYRNGETLHTYKFYFSNIEQITDYTTHLELLVNGQVFLIKKESLAPNSVFFCYMRDYPKKTKHINHMDGWRLASIVLFIVTLLTQYIGLGILSAFEDGDILAPKHMWVMFALTPIPISSIVYGFILKHKGYKYLKNVIAGFIILGLCCAFGSFSLIFKNMYSEDDRLVLQAEQVMDVDIPQYRSIATQDWRMGTSTDPNRKTQFVTKVRFDDVENIQLLKEIKADDRWLNTMPNDVYYIASASYIPALYDYVVTYNSDTDEYNTVPQNDGTYTCICMMYSSTQQELTIEEYTLTYTK